MQHAIHESGLGVGWALIAVGNLVHFLSDHGMTLLSVTSIVFGMFCQGYVVWHHWSESRHRRPRRRW